MGSSEFNSSQDVPIGCVTKRAELRIRSTDREGQGLQSDNKLNQLSERTSYFPEVYHSLPLFQQYSSVQSASNDV